MIECSLRFSQKNLHKYILLTFLHANVYVTTRPVYLKIMYLEDLLYKRRKIGKSCSHILKYKKQKWTKYSIHYKHRFDECVYIYTVVYINFKEIYNWIMLNSWVSQMRYVNNFRLFIAKISINSWKLVYSN